MKIKWKIIYILLIAGSLSPRPVSQTLHSPDGKIKLVFTIVNTIRYAVYYNDSLLISDSEIGLQTDKQPGFLSGQMIKKITFQTTDTLIFPEIPQKRLQISDHFNQVTIRFREPIALVARAYNDGVAWRWVTYYKDSIRVMSERAQFRFPGSFPVYYPAVQKREDADIFHTSFEEPYQVRPVDSIPRGTLCFTPVLVAPEKGPRLLITESDLLDYPGMFLEGQEERSLSGKFAGFPLASITKGGEFKQQIVTNRADYIAFTRGTRNFPWRVIIVANNDKELPGNDMIYRLASPSRIPAPSWIHPGKGTDEWIIGINLFNVPFKAGLNTATYKYYIDFAKRFGFDRIMMDAGWSDYNDLFSINPQINMDSLADYARQKGIKLSLWTLAQTLDRQLEEALVQFNRWGVDFIMTDFMDRDDQLMVRFYERVAEACARHKIMIMYHGAFKPAGFERTWPNAITRESVLGSEYNIWSEKATPEHDLLLPFIRMVSGPMDYEPGLLDNASRDMFRPIPGKVMSMGTRCHQLAMFVVYDSPMQIFSGNPSQGWMEPRFMELLGGIPSSWDETIILDARLGDYILSARKKGNDWYIGAMTDWTRRTLTIDCSFLEDGDYEMEKCTDGINAERYGSDYQIESGFIRRNDKIEIFLAPGGGAVIRLRKK